MIVYWSIEVPMIVFSSLNIVYGHLLELLRYPLISITLELNFDIKEIKFTYTMYGLKWSSQFRDLESIIKKEKRCAFKVFLKKSRRLQKKYPIGYSRAQRVNNTWAVLLNRLFFVSFCFNRLTGLSWGFCDDRKIWHMIFVSIVKISFRSSNSIVKTW